MPLLRPGGAIIVVNQMHYEWESPAHDCYREFFEQARALPRMGGLGPCGEGLGPCREGAAPEHTARSP